MNEPIIVAVINLFTVFGVAYLSYRFGIKSKRSESALKHKEEQYSKLLVKLQGFVGQTANTQAKIEFFEELYRSWLYSSDEVIEAIKRMVDLLIENKGRTPEPSIGRKVIGDIVVAMRKDLFGKTKLDHEAFRYTDVIDR
jgi:hypothetical protein